MTSDTFFTQSPEWHWLVVLYFFLGGIAGGSYFLAALMDLFGHRRDLPLVRTGYYVAFIAVLFCPILLVADLSRPERFWHMLLQNHTLAPAFKFWSPISVGSWGLFLFGGFATLSLIGAMAEDGRLPLRGLVFLRRSPLRQVIAAVGALTGFFVAGYTGVLLDVTNRVLWGDTPLLGLLFLTSAASTAASLLLLLGSRRRAATRGSLRRLSTMELLCAGLELLVLVVLVLTVAVAGAGVVWLSWWGLLLLLGVVGLGILAPMLLHWSPRLLGGLTMPASALMALAGGFILRAVVVLSAQAV